MGSHMQNTYSNLPVQVGQVRAAGNHRLRTPCLLQREECNEKYLCPIPKTSQWHRRKDMPQAAHFSVLPARVKPLRTLQNMTPNG